MRDIALLLALLAFIPFIIKKPFIGVVLSVWASLFTPSLWVFGFGTSLRVNLVITIFTILSALFQSKLKNFKWDKLTFLVSLFFIWGTLSALFNKSNSEIVWLEWSFFWKTIFLYFICLILIDTKRKIDITIWALVLSASYIGAVEGLKFLASFGGHVIEGPNQSKLQDRNALSLALNMTILLILYLYQIATRNYLKIFLTVLGALNIVAIIGSYSRGGLIGLSVLVIFFIMNSKNKFKIISAVTLACLLFVQYLPEKWINRMDTIQTAQEDGSFLGRVAAWKEAILIANDYPILGVGFKGGQNFAVWKNYEPEFSRFDHIIDTSGLTFSFAKAAHSIYFQVLGDMGYIGLLIFIAILYQGYKRAKKQSKDKDIYSNISNVLFISIVCYAISGAALSLPYFDILFIYLALIQAITNRKEVHASNTDNLD